MASYEDAAGIIGIFEQAAADNGVSEATAAAITALVTGLTTAGAAVAVQQEASSVTNAAQVTAPIVMMADNTSVDATFGADSPVKAVILGKTDQASDITFQTSDDVTVQLGGATGDQVTTGGGDDAVTFAGGSATIDAGSGSDTIVLQGNGSVNIQQGAGNSTIKLESNGVAATIDAGSGFDKLEVGDGRGAHTFRALGNGRFEMHSGEPITMENVNVVQFTNDAGTIDDITVLAASQNEALVALLYQVGLDRQAIDANGGNTDGLEFWLDNAQYGINNNADPSFVAAAFAACQEFQDKTGALSNQDYVQQLMNNISAGTVAIAGEDAAYYAAKIDSGEMSRADVLAQFAISSEALDAFGNAGDGYVIEGWIA